MIVGVEPVHRFLQLDIPPQRKLFYVTAWIGQYEALEGAIVVAAVVQHVAEIDLRLSVRGIQVKCATQPADCGAVIAQPMGGIPHARCRLRRFGLSDHGELESVPGTIKDPLAE